MKNTIASLALVKINWDSLRRDYIENFVPFLATLIRRRRYKRLDLDTLCVDFEQEFGLRIPFHPMITLLNRAKKRKLVGKREGNFIPVPENLPRYDFGDRSGDQIRKQE